MTPEERQLIADLFDRMRSFGVPIKDREAEALISQSVRAFPDAPYMLVQSALVQEQALQQASSRIQDLEENLRALGDKQSQASGSGGFLGGLFGGGRAPSSRSSSSSPGDQAPWRQEQSPPQQSAAPPPAPGGFMHSAMTTAAGVAGGMLVSGAVRDMLGGRAHASPTSTEQGRRDPEALARQDAADDAAADLREQDAQDDAEADAADDASSDRDDSGGDTEI